MQLGNSNERYGVVAIAFHWGSAFAVVTLFALGLWMRSLDYYDPWYRTGPWLHKGIGVTLGLVLLLRLAWRRLSPVPPPLASHSIIERRAAAAVHALIYALLFAVMAAGYLISTADGRSLEVFDLFELPSVIAHKQLEEYAGKVHLVLAITLMIVATLHAAAALKHHLFDKDRTLLRMLGR